MSKSVNKIHKQQNRVYLLCEKRNLSFEELFKALQEEDKSIGREAVRSWYYRDSIPRDTNKLKALCRVLDCDANYLFGLCEETTMDRHFICKETGLNEQTVSILQKDKTITKGKLIHVDIKPYGSAIDYLVLDRHGRSLLTLIIDYLFSKYLHLSYQGEDITKDLEVVNTYSEYTHTISPDDYGSMLLMRITQELRSMKDELKK